MGFLSTFNILTIIRCAQYLCKRFNVQSLDYADVFGYSVSIGPKFSRNFGKETKTIVAATVSAATIGYCIVYVSLAASYMQQLIQMHVDDHFNLRSSVLVFCVMLIPISLTTTLTLLAPFSTLGNVVNIINLAAILEYVCRDLPNIDSRPWFHSETEQPGLLLIAISNLMFSFEGIGSVLPIENRLIDKESYGGWNGLACLGMTIVVSMYTGFGFFGLLKFGEKTQPSLLLNLPSTGTYVSEVL
ncbi:proton-coupled amino acid transporter 2-like [Argopecten irradians]|uniref:proton-coupled amino acid transporter 2-like n=1 Tax=Argopecten irradians TaxID=31199 RepID=UPI00371D961F